jgi:hypothetical protein
MQFYPRVIVKGMCCTVHKCLQVLNYKVIINHHKIEIIFCSIRNCIKITYCLHFLTIP